MSDFPTLKGFPPQKNTFGMASPGSGWGDYMSCVGPGAPGSGAIATANAAGYYPVLLTDFITPVQAVVQVGTQAGNVDVGLYREDGGAVWRNTPVAVGAAGIQTFSINAGAGVALVPGLYWMAFWCSSTSAAFIRWGTVNVSRPIPVGGEVSLASGLPTTASMSFSASSYYPVLSFHARAS